jgi:hypothetical protein
MSYFIRFSLSIRFPSKNSERLSMSSPDADYIQHRLLMFEQCVDDTVSHFHELATFGPWPASAPYREKYAIRVLINTPGTINAPFESHMQEYNRINRKLEEFRDRKSKEYLLHLISDLQQYIHAYHAALCHAQFGSCSTDILRDLARRELIEELCRELTSHYDLSGIDSLLRMLDENVPENATFPLPTGAECRAEPGYACKQSSAEYLPIISPGSPDSIPL